MLKAAVVTLFPELFSPFLSTSILKRVSEAGGLTVLLEPLRNYGIGKHRSVDDTPYAGGSGMVMRVDVIVSAIEGAEARLGVKRAHRVLLTPQGMQFHQRRVEELARLEYLLLVCGRYEGFDERVRSFVDEELTVGDFVLAGGEVAAMAVIEACARFLPGALGNQQSYREESFSADCGGLLEYPQFTRPPSFRGLDVPELLLSGDHAKVAAWRREQSLERTQTRRPDLIPPKKS